MRRQDADANTVTYGAGGFPPLLSEVQIHVCDQFQKRNNGRNQYAGRSDAVQTVKRVCTASVFERNQKRKVCLTVVVLAILLTVAASLTFLVSASPPKDGLDTFDYPPSFFCEDPENRIDLQTDGKCAAYAAAYLLRYFGEEANGEDLFSELTRPFGFASVNSITDVFHRRGYGAKAFCGSLDTLKQRLTEGHPVIVFIQISGDTHYAVVVGYDEQYIYLADSLAETQIRRIHGTTWFCQPKSLKRYGKHRRRFPTTFISYFLKKQIAVHSRRKGSAHDSIHISVDFAWMPFRYRLFGQRRDVPTVQKDQAARRRTQSVLPERQKPFGGLSLE